MLNDASFNEFIKQTLGSNEDATKGGVSGGGGIGGGIESLNFDVDIERPSMGGGIHRGSSDIVMFQNALLSNSELRKQSSQNNQKGSGNNNDNKKEGVLVKGKKSGQ